RVYAHSHSTPFPTRRSTDLGNDLHAGLVESIERAIQRRGLPRAGRAGDEDDAVRLADQVLELLEQPARHAELGQVAHPRAPVEEDRKSTRLNSSHGTISYAV